MALDKAYFDAIHIDVVKKKYYNANKVEAVFADIRRQAEAMEAECAAMRAQLSVLDDKKFEIGDAVISAQQIYKEILDKANARADEIVAEAEQRAAAIQEDMQRQQEYSVQHVERCFTRMREQHESAIDSLNAAWQDFLCGLYPESLLEREEVPADLDEKVGAIAQELLELERDRED